MWKDANGGVWYEVLSINIHRESFILGVVAAMLYVVFMFGLAGVKL